MGGSCSFLATQPMCPAKVPGCSAEAQSLCSRQSFTKALGSTRSPGKRGHSENPTNRRNGGIPQGSLCHSRQPRPVYVQCVPPFKGKPRRQQEREQHGATTTPGFPKVIVLGEKNQESTTTVHRTTEPPTPVPCPCGSRPCVRAAEGALQHLQRSGLSLMRAPSGALTPGRGVQDAKLLVFEEDVPQEDAAA